MSDEKALIPIEERQIDFYGDDIIAVLVKVGGQRLVYVPVRPISDHLGLAWSKQLVRIQRHPVLSQVGRTFPVQLSEGKQDMLCLPLDMFSGWIFTVNPGRDKPALQEKLLLYRRECFRFLSHTASQKVWIVPLPQNKHRELLGGMTRWNIAEKVRKQRLRAQEVGLPATLSVEEWIETMKHFGWRCAYCQERLGVIIEHVVPLSLGGGTTKTNCVPSCYSCNSQKNNLHPDQVTKLARERLEAIRVYLASSE